MATLSLDSTVRYTVFWTSRPAFPSDSMAQRPRRQLWSIPVEHVSRVVGIEIGKTLFALGVLHGAIDYSALAGSRCEYFGFY